MAIIFCYECGKQISDQAKKCPHCAAPSKDIKKQFGNIFAYKKIFYPLGILFIVISLLFFSGMNPLRFIDKTIQKIQNMIESYKPMPLYFRGTMGDTEIRMVLYRDKNDFEGFYYFSKENKSHNNLPITGSINQKYYVVLKDDKNNIFSGTWNDDNTTLITIDGKFQISTKNTLPKKLELIQEPIFLKDNQKILTHEIYENYKKKNMHVTISLQYPLIQNTVLSDGNKVNNHLMLDENIKDFKKNIEEVAGEVQEFDKTRVLEPDLYMSYEIKYLDSNYTSLAFTYSPNDGRQATWNGFWAVINIKNSTGKILELRDLFQDESYLNTISEYVRKNLMEDYARTDEFFMESSSPKEENFQNWTFTPTGIEVFFNKYAIGAGNTGMPHIIIPYKAFGKFLKINPTQK